MAKVTPRLHHAYLAWIEMQWDRPSRTDYYVMQNTLEVVRSNQRVRNPNSVKMKHMLIPFNPEPKQRRKKKERLRTELAKGALKHRINQSLAQTESETGKKIAPVKRTVSKEEAMAEYEKVLESIPTPDWMK
jgi:hypothetical protein